MSFVDLNGKLCEGNQSLSELSVSQHDLPVRRLCLAAAFETQLAKRQRTPKKFEHEAIR